MTSEQSKYLNQCAQAVFSQHAMEEPGNLALMMTHITVFNYFVSPQPVQDIWTDLIAIQQKVWNEAGLAKEMDESSRNNNVANALINNRDEIERVYDLIEPCLIAFESRINGQKETDQP